MFSGSLLAQGRGSMTSVMAGSWNRPKFLLHQEFAEF